MAKYGQNTCGLGSLQTQIPISIIEPYSPTQRNKCAYRASVHVRQCMRHAIASVSVGTVTVRLLVRTHPYLEMCLVDTN